MTYDLRTWPIGLRRLAEVIGPAAAVRMADVYGGTESNYIPKHPRRDHPLVQLIGYDKLALLCATFGPGTIDIPRGTFRDLKKAKILESTGSSRVIAQDVGCTERYVRMVRNSVDHEDDRQASLFDPD